MTNFPLVSVIIPTYNRAGKIKNAIQSVFDQTYPNIQIIVVDDGSTDETANVVSNMPNVTYILQDHAGQATARNTGLKRAKGAFIATLDTDDVWLPKLLSIAIDKLITKKLDIVFTNWLQEDKKGKWNDFLVHYSYIKPFLNTSIDNWVYLDYTALRKLYIQSCPSPSSSVVMRKSAMPLGWNNEMVVADDWCLYLDMILNNKSIRVAFTTTVLWQKAIGTNNLMDGRNRLEVLKLVYVDDVEALLNRFQKLLNKKEIETFKKMKIASLIELAKNHFQNYHFKQGLKNLKNSFNSNFIYTIWAIPNIFFGGLGKFIK